MAEPLSSGALGFEPKMFVLRPVTLELTQTGKLRVRETDEQCDEMRVSLFFEPVERPDCWHVMLFDCTIKFPLYMRISDGSIAPFKLAMQEVVALRDKDNLQLMDVCFTIHPVKEGTGYRLGFKNFEPFKPEMRRRRKG